MNRGIWDAPDYGWWDAPFPALLIYQDNSSGYPRYLFVEQGYTLSGTLVSGFGQPRQGTSGYVYATEVNGTSGLVGAGSGNVWMRHRGSQDGNLAYEFVAPGTPPAAFVGCRLEMSGHLVLADGSFLSNLNAESPLCWSAPSADSTTSYDIGNFYSGGFAASGVWGAGVPLMAPQTGKYRVSCTATAAPQGLASGVMWHGLSVEVMRGNLVYSGSASGHTPEYHSLGGQYWTFLPQASVTSGTYPQQNQPLRWAALHGSTDLNLSSGDAFFIVYDVSKTIHPGSGTVTVYGPSVGGDVVSGFAYYPTSIAVSLLSQPTAAPISTYDAGVWA